MVQYLPTMHEALVSIHGNATYYHETRTQEVEEISDLRGFFFTYLLNSSNRRVVKVMLNASIVQLSEPLNTSL